MSSAPVVDDRVRDRVLFFVFITVFLDLIGFGIVFPLLPFYVESMGGSPATVGFILASFSISQLIASPVLGRLSDRFGRRPVILVSLFGNALSMVVFALATRVSLLPLLFFSRIVAGFTAGNLAACQAAIADVMKTGEERARGMGRLGAGIGLGFVLGPVLGSTLSHFGAWAPPLGAAAIAIADLLGAVFLMPETRHFPEPDPAEAVAQKPRFLPRFDSRGMWLALSRKRVVLVLLLYFFLFLVLTNMQVALALLAKARLDWGSGEIGHIFGLIGLITLVVQGFLVGRLARVFGQINLVIVGSLFSAAGMLAVSLAYHAAPLLAGLALVALGYGIVNPLLSSIAADAAGETSGGTVLGIAQSSGGLARTLGPILGGILFARIGAGAPFAAGAVSAMVCVLLGLILRNVRDDTVNQ
ncbi:MAG: MFS transporter [Polyangiaceae bacterium]